ncbi:MAG: hypothetical protein IK130_02695 [Oscillospiraceae bacterium]|nr:hypothetical protein [Oscillospiraceae bacterium]
MSSEALRAELRMLAVRSLLLDLAAYLISTLWIGFTASFAWGLLLGTALLFGTLLLLNISIVKMAEDAKRAGVTNQRRYVLFYALRLLLFAAGFGTALVLRAYISPVGTAIPMLYPRLIYTLGALIRRPDSQSGGKKR